MITIKNVKSKSPAGKAGIKSGDVLAAVNGNAIEDVLDYMFFSAAKNPMIGLSDRTVAVKKGEYEDLGLEFDTFLMSDSRRCKNKCVFCFIDQLPKGMRETLYFKDDDSRLSFLQGNYISLTNLTDHEAERIMNMKLSVNVSVHTTDKALRCQILGNPNAGQALEYLYKIAESKVELNCQIVICPGINDGKNLEKTLLDLTALYPSVKSIACVPVGLTKHRGGLAPLVPFDKESAESALDIIEQFGEHMLRTYGDRLVYASDELFIKAGREIPDYDYYGGFPQYENGVGMLTLLDYEFKEQVSKAGVIKNPRKKSIATGVLAAPSLEKLVEISGANVKVHAIKNDFFGRQVTVAGLVTGSDLINQLLPHKNELGEELLIPSSMLRAGDDVFLDDITVRDVQTALGVKVRAVECDGGQLYEALAD